MAFSKSTDGLNIREIYDSVRDYKYKFNVKILYPEDVIFMKIEIS